MKMNLSENSAPLNDGPRMREPRALSSEDDPGRRKQSLFTEWLWEDEVIESCLIEWWSMKMEPQDYTWVIGDHR